MDFLGFIDDAAGGFVDFFCHGFADYRGEGSIDSFIHRSCSGAGDFRGHRIGFLVDVVLDFRRVDVPGEDSGEALAKVWGDDQGGVTFAGAYLLQCGFRGDEVPPHLVVIL